MLTKYIIFLVFLILIISLFLNKIKIKFYKNYKNIPINFILLERDKERHKYIKNLIKKNNINHYNIVKATDGKNINLQYFIDNNYITNIASMNMRLGAIGCAISHIKLWETFLNTNEEFLIVMEDDISFDNTFRNKLSIYLNNLPNDFDITQIFLHPGKYFKKKFKLSKNINKYVKKGYGQWGTVSYILSKKGAYRLLKLCKPIFRPIDEMIKRSIEKNIIISYIPNESLVNTVGQINGGDHQSTFKSNIW